MVGSGGHRSAGGGPRFSLMRAQRTDVEMRAGADISLIVVD